MKGKLKKTEKGWFVEYESEPAGDNIWINTLPLCEDHVTAAKAVRMKDGDEVEFTKEILPFDVHGVNDVTYCAKIK